MKKLISSVVILISLQAQSQKTESLEGMNSTEIRRFLMTQTESVEAREMIRKYNASRIASYIFFSGGFVTLAFQDKSNENSVILTSFYGGTCLIAGLITAIAANERFKKAKNRYQTSEFNSDTQLGIQIRNEDLIINSIFKYPKPR